MRRFLESVTGLVLLLIVFLVVTFPVTWLLMLFLGNVGLHVGYGGTLPLGTVVSLLIGAASTGAHRSRWSGPPSGAEFEVAVAEFEDEEGT